MGSSRGAMRVLGEPSPLLRATLDTLSGLHDAFDRHPSYEKGASRTTCVQCALTAREFLLLAGIKDTRVAPVAVVMRAIRSAEQVAVNWIGSENGKPAHPTKWNGHIVAIADGFLIDLTSQLAGTDKVAVPEMIALPITSPGAVNLGLRVLAQVRAQVSDVTVGMQWLDTPRNTGWTKGLDPRSNKARNEIARMLLATHQAGIIARV